MATHCSISVRTTDGIKSVYCHFDGHKKGVGALLENHYNTQEKAEELIAGGDISVLGERCDKPEGHSFENPVDGYTVYYGRDRGEENKQARTYHSLALALKKEKQEYCWVFDDGRWYHEHHPISSLPIDEYIVEDYECWA
ncbi:post-segregation killing protein PndC [Salmonella enterica]|uniref:post-segregation killing protein PndC n=1 Tax=Salmonella enterica TaxID=28901 RepID=UPI003D3181EA